MRKNLGKKALITAAISALTLCPPLAAYSNNRPAMAIEPNSSSDFVFMMTDDIPETTEGSVSDEPFLTEDTSETENTEEDDETDETDEKGETIGSSEPVEESEDEEISSDEDSAPQFFADTDLNGIMNYDENMVSVSTVPYSLTCTDIQTEVSDHSVATSADVSIPTPLDRATISIGVSGSTLSMMQTANLTLKITFTLDGCDTQTQEIKPSQVKMMTSSSYEISYEIIAVGNSFRFETSPLRSCENLSIQFVSYASHSSNYIVVKADAPEGHEDLFISLRKGDYTPEQLEKWTKRLCVYANSLSDITDVKLGTLYMCFDDPANLGYAYSYNYRVNASLSQNGYNGFSKECTDSEIDTMINSPDVFSWALLHEIGHSYGVYTSNRTFEKNYKYHDEILTNIRGLTAFQNCDNLRELDIMYNSDVLGKYSDVFSKYLASGENSSDWFAGMGEKLSDIGNNYGWETFVTFYRADCDIDYFSENNMDAANLVKTFADVDVNVHNTPYLKFVNGLRRIYQIAWNQDYSQFAFEYFLRWNFGADFLNLFINSELKSDTF